MGVKSNVLEVMLAKIKPEDRHYRVFLVKAMHVFPPQQA